jgi:hypothetical protein
MSESQAVLKITKPVKLLAFVAAASIIVTLVSGALGIVSMRNFFLRAIDPKHMRESAIAITGLKEPLPAPDFTYVMVSHPVVFMERAKDKAQISYWTYEGNADTDLAEDIDKAYGMGILSPQNWVKFQSIKAKGKKEINGRTVTYVQGPMKDAQDVTYEGLIASVQDGKKVTMLKAYQPSDRPFDTDQVLGWLVRP